MPPPVQVLAHVRAPRGAEADARYRAQAQACLDFEPASSFEFEDTTDIFRSYVLEEDEEVVKGLSSKKDDENGLRAGDADPGRQPVESALQSRKAQEDAQNYSYDESGTGFDDESARLEDWIPLEQSSSSARTSKLSQVTHQTLVEQTPVAMSKSLKAIAEEDECRSGDEDVDDGEGSVASFLTPPSVVPDSQTLDDAAEMLSPLANPELIARRSRWRRPGRLADDATNIRSPLKSRSSENSKLAESTAVSTDDDGIDQPSDKRPSHLSDTGSQTSPRFSGALAEHAQHASQATTKSGSSGGLDTQGSWNVETNQTPTAKTLNVLPLHSSSISEQISLESPPKRRRLLPVLPPSSPSNLVSSQGSGDMLSHASDGSLFEKRNVPFSMFRSLLPLEIFSPEPESALKERRTHVTRALDMMARHEGLNNIFRPARRTRELKKTERGHWVFRLRVLDAGQNDDIGRYSKVNSNTRSLRRRHQSPSNDHSNHWDFDQFKRFWNCLSQFVSTGKAGSTTWCICEPDDCRTDTLSGPQQLRARTRIKNCSVQVQIKVYTCGELASHIWLLLNVASNRTMKTIEGVVFKDAGENDIIEMG